MLLAERHDAQLPPRSQVIRCWRNRLGPEVFFQPLGVKWADSMGQDPEKVQNRLAERILAERQRLTLKNLAADGRDVIALDNRYAGGGGQPV